MVPGGATVMVDGGRIVGVEGVGAAVPAGCAVVDLGDATLLPGLIDTHTHLGGDGRNGALDRLDDYTDAELDAVIGASLQDHLAAGVTTVRDLGDRLWSVVAWRDRQRSSALAGANGAAPEPTIVASGPPITCPEGHCRNMGGVADGPDELRAAVRERVDRRVDVVKIMASGGAMTANTNVLACQFSLEDLRVVVDEAHDHGLPVTAHAHGLEAVERALTAGVDGIEHCTCMTGDGTDFSEDLARRLAARSVAVCLTLGARPGVDPPPNIQALIARLKLDPESRRYDAFTAFQAGVRLVSGADTGIGEAKAHGVLPYAVAEFVLGGIPVDDALASATSVSAAVCGLGARKGRLRAGYDADILAVAGDPWADIDALAHPVAVMLAGALVTAPAPTAAPA